VVEGAGAAFFFLWCFLAVFGAGASAELVAAGESAAIGAAFFGISAAIAPAARPKVNKAEVSRVPDLFIASPTVGINKQMKEYDGS
jgi:hypothetical protein